MRFSNSGLFFMDQHPLWPHEICNEMSWNWSRIRRDIQKLSDLISLFYIIYYYPGTKETDINPFVRAGATWRVPGGGVPGCSYGGTAPAL